MCEFLKTQEHNDRQLIAVLQQTVDTYRQSMSFIHATVTEYLETGNKELLNRISNIANSAGVEA